MLQTKSTKFIFYFLFKVSNDLILFTKRLSSISHICEECFYCRAVLLKQLIFMWIILGRRVPECGIKNFMRQNFI